MRPKKIPNTAMFTVSIKTVSQVAPEQVLKQMVAMVQNDPSIAQGILEIKTAPYTQYIQETLFRERFDRKSTESATISLSLQERKTMKANHTITVRKNPEKGGAWLATHTQECDVDTAACIPDSSAWTTAAAAKRWGAAKVGRARLTWAVLSATDDNKPTAFRCTIRL